MLMVCLSQASTLGNNLSKPIEHTTNLDTTVHLYKSSVKLDSVVGRLEVVSEKADWDQRLPWILASLISVMTVLVTYILGRHQISSSEKQSKRTINLALEQIKSDLTIAGMNLNAQVLSTNRQEWINELRNISAIFLSKAIDFRSEFAYKMNEAGGFEEDERIKQYKNEMNFTATKIEFMLNPDEQPNVHLLEIMNIIKAELMSPNVSRLEAAVQDFKLQIKAILKSEWKRVKEMQ